MTCTASKALLLWVRWNFGNLLAVYWNLQVKRIVWLQPSKKLLRLCSVLQKAETPNVKFFVSTKSCHSKKMRWHENGLINTITTTPHSLHWLSPAKKFTEGRGSRGVFWQERGRVQDLWYDFYEVEDETRRGFFPFSSAFSRTRLGIPQNFGLALSHFKDETFDPSFSRSRTRRGDEFCPIPRPFRGPDEIRENLWLRIRVSLLILFPSKGFDLAEPIWVVGCHWNRL